MCLVIVDITQRHRLLPETDIFIVTIGYVSNNSTTNKKHHEDDKHLILFLVIVIAAVIILVSLTLARSIWAVSNSNSYTRVEFAAPPLNIPGSSFGWNICAQNTTDAQMSCTNDEKSYNSTALPPITIGNGEDVNQTTSAPPNNATQQQKAIVVFGR